MNKLSIATAAALFASVSCVSCAGAQTSHPATQRLDLTVTPQESSGSSMPPNAPAVVTDASQVKRMLQAQGFTNVTVVPRHVDGQQFDPNQWLAQGTVNGRAVAVIVDENGTVTRRSYE
jgi:hypothetical protein